MAEELLVKLVREFFELRPTASSRCWIQRLIYQATAAYGHFGRDEFPWEKTDKAVCCATPPFRGLAKTG